MTSKPRIVKDFEKLPPDIQEQLKLVYPLGFHKNLVQYKNVEGKFVSALPFETDEKYYLIRMTTQEAKDIVEEDEDYDESGMLRDGIKEEYSEKYGELDYIDVEEIADESTED